jgi:putative nucleotidyltransferase with HDIG domain
MYFITLLPILIVTTGTVSVFFMHLVAGFMGIYVYQSLNKGWLQFVGTFIIYIIMIVVWLGFCLMFDNDIDFSLPLYIALSAGLAIAGYPLIYLFERMFMLVSAAKLVELSDTSNTLLRLLADKAPGTFHHSLQVMNLSDAAARAINANVPLVRAAALYHDIGKINNPQCFTENEVPGVKVHDGLSPRESAQLIIKHVADGIQLAEKHRLPKEIADVCREHHGTLPIAYFYDKAKKFTDGEVDISQFRYPGPKPKSKIAAIIMIADACEAAARALKDRSRENVTKKVREIVNERMSLGQFDDCEITLKELNIIIHTVVNNLSGVYHSRIEYPKVSFDGIE